MNALAINDINIDRELDAKALVGLVGGNNHYGSMKLDQVYSGSWSSWSYHGQYGTGKAKYANGHWHVEFVRTWSRKRTQTQVQQWYWYEG